MLNTLSEIWQYRSLVWALVCRHLNARYRGSILGFVWSFLNPLCLIAVYSLVFQYYIPLNGVDNYPLFLFAGLLPWIWFSSGLLESTCSISSGGSLITKAMFPPHVLPLVSVLTNLANFLFAIPLLIIFMLFHGIYLGVSIVLLPVIILIELIFLFGLGLALSSLNVRYRDVQHILGNFLNLWFFLCPIIYPEDRVPKVVLYLNPIAMYTNMYRKVFIYNQFPDAKIVLLCICVATLVLFIGNAIFSYYREDFAELV